MYRFLGALDADDVETIAAMAFMEMLEGGFTSVGEFHYLHHAIGGARYADIAEHCVRVAAAAEETGIGLTLLPVFYAHGGFGAQPPVEGQKRFLNNLDSFARLMEGAARAIAPLPDAMLGIAPHSLRAVTPGELAALLDTWRTGPVHIHIAEQVKEVEDCLAFTGQRPVEWLLANAQVDARWCLIHATHMTDSEAAALARSGAVAGLCPITEANLGDGIFNAPAFLDHGGAWGVGTDSNVEINAAGELRMFEYSQRLGLRARNVVSRKEGQSTGGALYRGALAGGARALARDEGRIAVGAPADLVVIGDEDRLAGMKGDQRLDAYLFAAAARSALHVIRRGKIVVAEGRHVARERITARFIQLLGRLQSL